MWHHMTWAKYGTEFFDQLAEYGLPADMDDACQLTHTQVLHYLYSTEEISGEFLKKNLRRVASSDKAEAAAAILVDFGIWEDRGVRYEIIHHADVYRQSLGFQIKNRKTGRERQQGHRAKSKGERAKGKGDPPEDPEDGSGVTRDVTRDITRDVTRDVTRYVTGGVTCIADRQTDRQAAFTKSITKQAEEEETSSGASSPRKVVRVFPDCATEGCDGRLNQAAVDAGRTVCGDCVWKEGVA